MKGLELSEKYFYEIGFPAIEKKYPKLLDIAAFGLIGGGSECMGFDDEVSLPAKILVLQKARILALQNQYFRRSDASSSNPILQPPPISAKRRYVKQLRVFFSIAGTKLYKNIFPKAPILSHLPL